MEEATFATPDLPLNLWVEIFHKLPLIWVGRCLRVCKQWYRLISDPLFASNYNPSPIRNHPISLLMECHCCTHSLPSRWDLIFLNQAFNNVSNNGVTCFATSESLERRPFRSHCDFFDEGQRISDHRVWVLGTCNGLVALYNSPGDFLLFNPCTKVEKRLRFDAPQSKEIREFFKYFRLLALYHDEARGEYKVLICDSMSFRIISLKDKGSFTPKTRSRVLQDLKLWKVFDFGQGWQATMVRGVPHWVCELSVGDDVVVIIYFDRLAEELRMVRLPKARASIRDHGQVGSFELGALDGELTVALELGENLDYEVWALKEYGNEPSWSLLFVIPKACDSFQILSRVSDDEILVFRQYLKMYNIRTQGYRKLILSNGFHEIMNYIPSLVSPNH